MPTVRNRLCPRCGVIFDYQYISSHGLSVNFKCQCGEFAVASEEVDNLLASPVRLAAFLKMENQSNKEKVFCIRRDLATSNLVGEFVARDDKGIQKYFL